jgi:hypothetical protein
MAAYVSLGTARNHICPSDPCPVCAPEPPRRRRAYWCERCDVYGKGLRCWSCGSPEVVWNRTATQAAREVGSEPAPERREQLTGARTGT